MTARAIETSLRNPTTDKNGTEHAGLKVIWPSRSFDVQRVEIVQAGDSVSIHLYGPKPGDSLIVGLADKEWKDVKP